MLYIYVKYVIICCIYYSISIIYRAVKTLKLYIKRIKTTTKAITYVVVLFYKK